ncbi:MAG TPA: hypothetical protein VF041_18710 [Gemmatimonadaceae bacterium]
MTTRHKPAIGGLPPRGSLAKRVAENDAAAMPRRKNYELDQRRIDLLKEALGAYTETEAITRAMDLALEMTAFSREVRRAHARMLGRGGFVHRFDDEAALDFSGFEDEEHRSPAAPHRPKARGGR